MATITDVATEYRARALGALSELPPFSPVLNRLLATLSSETLSVAKISDIIETDTVIAGNVLKLVNSALYGRRGTVNSVRHAVSLLGINKLRNTVFAMSISRVWSQVRTAPGWSMARFNLHSVACGLMCDALAQRKPVAYPEGAFAAGLFHDLGSLLISVALPGKYRIIQELRAATKASILECEEEVIGTTHQALSAEALATWNLPQAIQDAVREHHSPALHGALAPNGQFRLGAALHCADVYVNAAGYSMEEEQPESEAVAEPLAPLGIELANADFLAAFTTELEALGCVLIPD